MIIYISKKLYSELLLTNFHFSKYKCRIIKVSLKLTFVTNFKIIQLNENFFECKNMTYSYNKKINKW